jgi:hypothetical protein
LIAEHQGTDKTSAVPEADFDRSHVWTQARRPVRRDYFPFLELLQAQLNGNVLGNAEMHCTCVG